MENNFKAECNCPCGASSLTISQIPRTRFKCHCLTCQEVYGLPYADVVAFRASAVSLDDKADVEYLKFSANLDRGLCNSCKSPFVSFLSLGPFPKLALMPTASLPKSMQPPPAHSHIFYHSASTPVEDSLPKTSGAFKSNMTLFPALLSSAFGR